ncbi:conserved hypothetical protein [Ricinus communis]|uniref:Uncharacterized protein n=1 Tax=Ricinus communis TaxID=3988 RepID=B9S7W7_RICCO|nr:conserved hypothetical protein [Ricinus communis]
MDVDLEALLPQQSINTFALAAANRSSLQGQQKASIIPTPPTQTTLPALVVANNLIFIAKSHTPQTLLTSLFAHFLYLISSEFGLDPTV